MNMDYYQMASEANNRRRTLLRVAERNRWVVQARQVPESGYRRNLHSAALYRLGTLLTRWGDSLQTRYDGARVEPTPLLYEG